MFGHKRRGASMRPEPGRWQRRLGRPLRLLGALLTVGGIMMAVYGGLRVLFDPGLFPLRHVQLSGERRNIGISELNELARPYLGENFFRLDMQVLQLRFAAHPWIERVTIHRRWPDTVEVRFRERTAFAHWGENQMIDSNAQRFRPVFFRQLAVWPHLIGPDGHERLLMKTYTEASVMVGQLGLRIVRLHQDRRRAWRMLFDNGVEISLGREQFQQRLRRFIAIYPHVLSARAEEIALVDLRYGNGFAVRWKSPAADSAS